MVYIKTMKKTIKYYGLFDMTKKQYVWAQVGAFTLLAFFWAAVFFIDLSFLGGLSTLIFWFIVVVLGVVTIAESIETVIILKRFRHLQN